MHNAPLRIWLSHRQVIALRAIAAKVSSIAPGMKPELDDFTRQLSGWGGDIGPDTVEDATGYLTRQLGRVADQLAADAEQRKADPPPAIPYPATPRGARQTANGADR